MDDGRITRRMKPTASFSLTVQLLVWIAEESARRGISKSELVSQILEAARVAESAVAA